MFYSYFINFKSITLVFLNLQAEFNYFEIYKNNLFYTIHGHALNNGFKQNMYT